MHVLGFLNLILFSHVEKQITSQSLIEVNNWVFKYKILTPPKKPITKSYIFLKNKVRHFSKLNVFVSQGYSVKINAYKKQITINIFDKTHCISELEGNFVPIFSEKHEVGS